MCNVYGFITKVLLESLEGRKTQTLIRSKKQTVTNDQIASLRELRSLLSPVNRCRSSDLRLSSVQDGPIAKQSVSQEIEGGKCPNFPTILRSNMKSVLLCAYCKATSFYHSKCHSPSLNKNLVKNKYNRNHSRVSHCCEKLALTACSVF